jgi:hypothetical protein
VVSHSARELARKWGKLFAQIVPQLQKAGDGVTTVLARGPLPELTKKLLAAHGAVHVLDARRRSSATCSRSRRPADGRTGAGSPGAVAGLGAMLVLAAEQAAGS